MTISFLITTTQATKKNLDLLLSILLPQLKEKDDYEIYVEGAEVMQLGAKYNSLLKDATGKYVWILNDTDIISETAVEDIYSAIAYEPDIIGITGATNVNDYVNDWQVSIEGETKLCVNSPMKRELATFVKFRNRSVKAEQLWIKEMIKAAPMLKEEIIDKPIIQKRIGLKIVA